MYKYFIFIGIVLMYAGIAWADSATQEKPLDLGEAKVSPLPQEIIEKFQKLDRRGRFDPNFYKKYLDVGGIAVMGSDKVADEAFYEARYLTSYVLAKRKDILDAMARRNTRLIIIAYEEEVSEVPEYYRSDPAAAAQQNRRVRGYGGATLTSFGEENLLCYPGDRYSRENIMIHEFGHCIDGNLRRIDPNWNSDLAQIFDDARSQGLWDRTYSASNQAEYWAEGIQAYFDCCARSRSGEPDGVHNHVGNREELKEYDPNLYNFIEKTIGHIEWRYTRYNVRHPEGPVETRGVTLRPRDPNSIGRRRGSRRSTDANQPQSLYYEEFDNPITPMTEETVVDARGIPFRKVIYYIKNHQLKLVALSFSGYACPPLADVFIHQSCWWY